MERQGKRRASWISLAVTHQIDLGKSLNRLDKSHYNVEKHNRGQQRERDVPELPRASCAVEFGGFTFKVLAASPKRAERVEIRQGPRSMTPPS